MRERYGIIGFLSAVLLGLLICSLQADAYFGVDEDYLLRTEKPEGRGAGPYHFLEFVSGDTDSYTVQDGDTLWKIARKYYGSGASYEKLWEENKDRINTPETLRIGTRLDLEKRFYVNVGMQDYVHDDVMHRRSMSGPNAWNWDADGYPYQIFSMMSYRNDLGEQEIQWKDPVLEELVREQLAGLWKLTDEERAAFRKRPMTTADLSGVEDLYLYENREEGEVTLRLNGYEKSRSSVLFEENGAAGERPVLTTLDDLAHFTGLRGLDIHLQKSDITDFSAVSELTGLRELCLEIESAQAKMEDEDLAFLGKLKNLRLLYLYGWDHEQGNWAGTEPTYSLEKITDISVLENCRQLAYLKLTTGNVENYEFLAKLPRLYYIDLMGQDCMLNVKPDTSLMPNACFIEYYGKQIRFDVGGSREIEDDKY